MNMLTLQNLKKKIEKTRNDQITLNASQELRSLLNPLAKTQLVNLLSKFGCEYPLIAEEIKRVASTDVANRRLFVRRLAWSTTTESLCAAFLKHGEIEEGAVITDKASGNSRGYGFVTYKDIDSAWKALQTPTKLIDGQMTVCTLACGGVSTKSSDDQAQRRIFIGGLPLEATSEMLLVVFKKYGDIEEGYVAYDKVTNKSRGFGFVTYKTVKAARWAIADPQKMLWGRNITVKPAYNSKNKGVQPQVGMAPVHMAGYSYPGGIPYYHHRQPPPAAAAAPLWYSIQPQVSCSQYTPRQETAGPSAAAPPMLNPGWSVDLCIGSKFRNAR
ncbi:UBP1-associated protein 2C-like [Bidens hawaiensis]|uniref:UBP1-associated protein 2C-like n=1 Tax=Bidens hawaiensis TaxID=980011 RepID=UPI00404B9288